jgi:hypothetical protein
MNPTSIQPTSRNKMNQIIRISLFFMALTGFAQMPIFKRYYIADIPGLGWLDQFYLTHYLHYLTGAFLIGLVSYQIGTYFLESRHRFRVTVMGYIRGSALTGLMLTGILMMIKNFPGYGYPPSMIIALDLAHIGFTLMFLAASAWALAGKQKWLEKI